MTLICTDGRTIAWDGYEFVNDWVVDRKKQKVERIGSVVIGFAGSCVTIRRWRQSVGPNFVGITLSDVLDASIPEVPEEFKAHAIAVCGRTGSVWEAATHWRGWDQASLPAAIGSEHFAAMVLMRAAGMSPVEAVRAVARHCSTIGGEIQQMTIEDTR